MVLDAIKKQIEIQHDALSSHLLITSIIEGDEEDLTTHQIISVREQCQILSLALSIAVDNFPVWKNWNKCCEVAIALPQKWELQHLEMHVLLETDIKSFE